MHYFWVKKKWFLDGVLGYIAFSLILYINTAEIDVDVDPHSVLVAPFNSDIEIESYNAFPDLEPDVLTVIEGQPNYIYAKTYLTPDIPPEAVSIIEAEISSSSAYVIGDYSVATNSVDVIRAKPRRTAYDADLKEIVDADLLNVANFSLNCVFYSKKVNFGSNVASTNVLETELGSSYSLFEYGSELNELSVPETGGLIDYSGFESSDLEVNEVSVEELDTIADYTGFEFGSEAGLTTVSEFGVIADYSSDDHFSAEFESVDVLEYGFDLQALNNVNININADLETAFYLNFEIEVRVPKVDFYIDVSSSGALSVIVPVYIYKIEVDVESELATTMSLIVPLSIYKIDSDISVSIPASLETGLDQISYKIDFNNPNPYVLDVIEENGLFVYVPKIELVNRQIYSLNVKRLGSYVKVRKIKIINSKTKMINTLKCNGFTLKDHKSKKYLNVDAIEIATTMRCYGFTLSYNPEYYLHINSLDLLSTANFNFGFNLDADWSAEVNISFATHVNVIQLVTNNIGSKKIDVSIMFSGNRPMVFLDWGDAKIFKDLYGKVFSDLAEVKFAELGTRTFSDLARLSFNDLATVETGE